MKFAAAILAVIFSYASARPVAAASPTLTPSFASMMHGMGGSVIIDTHNTNAFASGHNAVAVGGDTTSGSAAASGE